MEADIIPSTSHAGNAQEPLLKKQKLDNWVSSDDAAPPQALAYALPPILNGQDTGNKPGYKLRYTLEGHRKAISAVKFSPDGLWMASSCTLLPLFYDIMRNDASMCGCTDQCAFVAADLSLHLHSLPTFNLDRTFVSHTAGVSDVAFSADSTLLASASDDLTVRIWELAAAPDSDKPEQSVRILHGHTQPVFCVAWNPRGDLVASGGMDETVRVWDVQRGKPIVTCPIRVQS